MTSPPTVPTPSEVLGLLDGVVDPCSVAARRPLGLQSMGLVSEVSVESDGTVDVVLVTTSPFCDMAGYFIERVEATIVAAFPDSQVRVRIDSDRMWAGFDTG